MNKKFWKTLVDVAIMVLTAIGGYLGASAQTSGLFQVLVVVRMRIVNCENPRYITSPHTGDTVLCHCGKCNTCADTRAKRWINRLDQESKSHRFTYMVTLTYNEDTIPAYYFDDEDPNYISLNRDPSVRIPLQELIDLCKDEYGEYLEYELAYLRDRLVHPRGLPAVYTKDISNFMKRLNKITHDKITSHYENYRYFCAHEYGANTYREHVHLLIWFDDREIAKRFDEVLRQAWTFGYTDCSMVYSDGGNSYVAQYLNKPLHLPSFYSHKDLRQRAQFSKFPSIGSFQYHDEEIREILYRKPLYDITRNPRTGEYSAVPKSLAFKDRFFPKCGEYCTRSHSDRVALYRSTEVIDSGTFEDFKESVSRLSWLADRNIANETERSIFSFVEHTRQNSKDIPSFYNSLRRLYRMSKRIVWYSRICGVSLDYYVKQIEDYYTKLEYENLKEMYLFQEDYTKINPSSDLVFMYPDLVKEVRNSHHSDFGLASSLVRTLQTFGLDDIGFDLKDTQDYKSMKFLHKRIFTESRKRKKANEEKDKAVLKRDPKLYNILKSFQKWHVI